jgi:hypothetical protein
MTSLSRSHAAPARRVAVLSALVLAPLFSGCYAAAIGVALGVVSISENDDGASTGSDPAPPILDAASFARVEDGSPVMIPYKVFDADGGCLRVEFEWTPVEVPERFERLPGRSEWRRARPWLGAWTSPPGLEIGSAASTPPHLVCVEPSPGPGVEPFVDARFIWDARADLSALDPELGWAQVRLRVRVEDSTGRSASVETERFVAGNEAPSLIGRIEVEGEDESADDVSGADGRVRFVVEVADSTSDAVEIDGFFTRVDPAEGVAAADLLPMSADDRLEEFSARASPDGARLPFEWQSADERNLAGVWAPRIWVAFRARDRYSEGPLYFRPEPISINNNLPARVEFLPVSGALDRAFEIPLQLVVSDAEGDPVDLVLQWSTVSSPFPEGLPLGDPSALRRLIDPEETDPLVLAERSRLRILTERPIVVRGTIGVAGPEGLSDRIRLDGLIESGAVYRFPTPTGSAPIDEPIVTERSGVSVIGRRVRVERDGELLGEARIEELDVATGEVLLDAPVDAVRGARWALELAGRARQTFTSPTGVVHTFLWDSNFDLSRAEAALDATVQVRAYAVDSHVGSESVPSVFALSSRVFVPGTRIALPSLPSAVASFDANGDGRDDLAVAVSRTAPLPSLAQIYFQSPIDGLAETPSRSLELPPGRVEEFAAGDVGGAGRMSLVAISVAPQSSTLAVFLAGGSGELGRDGADGGPRMASILAPLSRDATAVLVTDLVEGSGDEIVIIFERTQQVAVFAVEPDTLGEPAIVERFRLAFERRPRAIAVGDIDGDGAADLAVAGFDRGGTGPTDPFVSALLRDPGRTPSAAAFARRVDLPLGALATPVAISIGRLSGGPARDLAVVFEDSDTVAVWKGETIADGVAVAPDVSIPTSIAPRRVLVEDFNLDGRDDLIVFNGFAQSLWLFLTRDGGQLSTSPVQTIRVEHNAGKLAAGDLDGDGLRDLIIDSDGVSIFHQIRPGFALLGSVVDLQVPDSLEELSEFASGDLDGDGRSDAVCLTKTSGVAFVFLQTTLASWPTTPDWTLRGSAGREKLVVSDFNGDARQDFLLLGPSVATLDVFLQDGRGRLGVAASVSDVDSDERLPSRSLELGTGASDLALADVDDDGRADLLVVFGPESVLRIWRGRASGITSGAPADLEIPLAPGSAWIRVLDIDLDSRRDVVTLSRRSSNRPPTLEIRLQDESGGFRQRSDQSLTLPLAAIPTDFLSGDVNGDGSDDLVVSVTTNEAFVFERSNDGLGWLPPCPLSVNSQPTGIAVGDLNADGRDDLAACTSSDNRVRIFYQVTGESCSVRLRLQRVLSLENGPVRALIRDVSGDGRSDLAILTSRGQTIRLFVSP